MSAALASAQADLYADRVSWLRIKLRASSRDADLIADALAAAGALSVSIESAVDAPSLQRACESVALWEETRVTGLFAQSADVADVVGAARAALGVDRLAYESDRLDDADWEHAWRSQVRPLQVSDRLWIVPSWCGPPDPAAINVVLDPGLAFGTGGHPTTRLCLAWLAAQSLAGRAVIDYGCGSGILAIAALKRGAARAIGVDVDPQALAVSRENAARNGVSNRFIGCLPEELAAHETAAIVVANILSETLIALAPELTARLEPGGWLALSGILPDQAEEVRAAYSADVELTAQPRDGWVLLAGARKQ
jgi:ribosomal protein L11 methyltransferase